MANWFSARILLAGFILMLATLLIVLVVGNLRQSRTEAVLDIIRPDADLAMQKINYTETQDGQRKWSVQADSATHDFKENSAVIENIRMVIYDLKDGDMIVTAREGRLNMTDGLVLLRGDVVLENVNGQSVLTDELEFDDNTNLLSTGKAVQVVSDDVNLSGVGMRYDLDRKSLKLLSSVEASFRGALRQP